MMLLLTPHCDDETLFAAYTILRHQPSVLGCFGSVRDYGSNERRARETLRALEVLDRCPVFDFWDLPEAATTADLEARLRTLATRVAVSHVWAPHERASHPQHVAVATAARRVFGDRMTAYHTYVDGQKVREGRQVVPEPLWVQKKLQALACYTSQITHPRAGQFFEQDLLEYVEG